MEGGDAEWTLEGSWNTEVDVAIVGIHGDQNGGAKKGLRAGCTVLQWKQFKNVITQT